MSTIATPRPNPRKTTSVRHLGKVDIDDVIAGKGVDPVLEPNDIVYVPNSTVKSLTKGVAETLVRVVGRVDVDARGAIVERVRLAAALVAHSLRS